jgi:phosphatidylglycerophosphatase C
MATVLFDLDHTLVRFDSSARFMRELLVASPVRLPAAVAAGPVLAALWASPRRRTQALSGVLWLATAARRGPLEPLMEAFVARHFDDTRHVCPPAVLALRRHVEAGDRVIVVTGSSELLAARICRAIGAPGVEVVGSTVKPWRGGWISDVHCVGRRKVARLASRGVTPPWDVVYTDSASDLPLLRDARRRVLVNASPADVARVTAALGQVESLT